METSFQAEDPANGEPDLTAQVSQAYDIRMRESFLKKTAQEIASLEKELQHLRLEKKWCTNEEGERVIPSAEEQATKICEQISNDPDLVKDVVKALRLKKLDLLINIKALKEKCEAMDEEIR